MTAATQYRMTPVTELTPHPRNPRVGDVELIRESIRENGLYKPLVAQVSTGYVLAGNHTLQAAVAEGYGEVPVNWVDCDDDTALRILLVDNKSADQATYDDPVLLGLLQELVTAGSLIGTGYQGTDVDELERLAGELAKRNSAFLDDLAKEPGDNDDPEEPPEKNQYFNVTFLMVLPDRTRVMQALNQVQEDNELQSTTEALIHLADQVLANLVTTQAPRTDAAVTGE